MKLLWILALVLNVTGYGSVPEAGKDITITEATINPMTGKAQMELNGTVNCETTLTVTITRSKTGLNDEFCCADVCTGGNEELQETHTFEPQGESSWFVHYQPAAGSDVQVNYLFSDGTESRELRVHYIYEMQSVDSPKSQEPARKVLRDGLVTIEYGNTIYHL